MITYPSLRSHVVELHRIGTGVDDEGTPVQDYSFVFEFRAGFGSVNTNREQIVGQDGQRVDAALSTTITVDVRVNDKVIVSGREWRVVGVKSTGYTTRIYLSAWGNK